MTLTTRYAFRHQGRFPVECLACKLVAARELHIGPANHNYFTRDKLGWSVSSSKEFTSHSNHRVHKENVILMRMHDLGYVAHRHAGNVINITTPRPPEIHEATWGTWLLGAAVYLGLITVDGFITSMLREPHDTLKMNDVKMYLAQRGYADSDRFSGLKAARLRTDDSLLEFGTHWRERTLRSRMTPGLNTFIDAWHRSCEPVQAVFSQRLDMGRRSWKGMRIIFLRRDACERLGEWLSLLLANLSTQENVSKYHKLLLMEDQPDHEKVFASCNFMLTSDHLELLPALVVPSTVDDAPQPAVDVFRIRGTGRQRTDFRTVDKSTVKSATMRLKF
ncbi:hypothetical protein [Caudoviricetes sp.]|nr:hypothetical protein [Caudoviricetes sp.]